MIGDILKNVLKTNASVLLILKCRLKWKIDDIATSEIDLGLDIETNLLNIKYVSV